MSSTQLSPRHSTLFWTEREDDMLFRLFTPWERVQKERKKEAKWEGTFPHPLLHDWRVTVHRRKQDHISELDNKEQRPFRRQERAEPQILPVCVFCLCVTGWNAKGHVRTCNITALLCWPRRTAVHSTRAMSQWASHGDYSTHWAQSG